jgi:RNA polymerase sigma-70 factor (ECF subfamily)
VCWNSALICTASAIANSGHEFPQLFENCLPLAYDGGMQRRSVDSVVLEECLVRMRAGDAAARDQLLQHCGDRFERLARHMLRSFPSVRRWEETGDVLQNSMLRLLTALDSVQPDSVRHFLALAATQIRRELIDLARRYQGPQSPAAHHASWGDRRESSTQANPAEGADVTYEPGRLAEWCELHEQIAALPMEEREVCELLWYQGLTQTETAGLLEVSERTVKRRWQAVRLKLHESFQGGFFS